MLKHRIIYVFIAVLAAAGAHGQVLDSAAELGRLAKAFKELKNMSYHYEMDAVFPNGEKDHVKGVCSLDNDEKLYLNDCDAFTILYTGHWFYKADHRKRTVAVVNLDKDYNKKLKAATEKDIFQNGAMTNFLDSVVVKKAKIRQYAMHGDTLKIKLELPKAENAQKIEIEYDTARHLFTRYNMTVEYRWQVTQKSVQVIETKIRCSDFSRLPANTVYTEDHFFSLNDSKIELKKYVNYKLSNKM